MVPRVGLELLRALVIDEQLDELSSDIKASAVDAYVNIGSTDPIATVATDDINDAVNKRMLLDSRASSSQDLLERFEEVILRPRGLDYKIQFPGPTGTNAVESALKLARKVTGREGIVSFTNAFHGMTLGSLAVTGNGFKRGGAGVPGVETVVVLVDLLAHQAAGNLFNFIGRNLAQRYKTIVIFP